MSSLLSSTNNPCCPCSLNDPCHPSHLQSLIILDFLDQGPSSVIYIARASVKDDDKADFLVYVVEYLHE